MVEQAGDGVERGAERASEEETGATPTIERKKELRDAGDSKREVEDLMGRVLKQETAAKENLELAQRIQADFDNFRKRAAREKQDLIGRANEKLIFELLPTLDNLERARDASGGADDLRIAIKKAVTDLSSDLRSYGLREIPTDGRFDPNLHEALCTGDGEEGEILEVFQKGYFLGSNVLRHAKVKVGKQEMVIEEIEGESNG
jgi:molecular chaperone GrpE